ncbi:MAG: DUF1738 domain-containing protein [Sphingobacteriales bacterium]|nr:MAG: DUF1738 domain-containing protein [Sphingobacteriales bacterium]
MSNANKTDIYERVTNRIISLIESHQVEKYTKTWIPLGAGGAMAQNPVSGTVYSGINQLLLSFEMAENGFPLNKWLTFKQVNELKGKVLKGSKATEVVYTNYYYLDKDKKRYSFEKIQKMQQEGKDLSALGLQKHGFLKFYFVFNVMQTENLPTHFYDVPAAVQLTEFEKDENAEGILTRSGATIIHRIQDRAYYRPGLDDIVLPIRAQFTGSEPFYRTAFHELGHWTGHKSRLNRDLTGTFGDENYAYEELIAELTTAFICAELGFSSTITNNVAYINSWLSALNKDTAYIIKAASNAHKAAEYIHRICKENVQQAAA